jgi:hypothetical protein
LSAKVFTVSGTIKSCLNKAKIDINCIGYFYLLAKRHQLHAVVYAQHGHELMRLKSLVYEPLLSIA